MNVHTRNKVLFFIGAGAEMVPGIRWACEMGLTVVAADMNPNAIGFQYADHAEVVSVKDVERTVEAAKRYHHEIGVDGVMTLACDVPLTVAAVADALGLPGLSVAAAQVAQDKLLMKHRLAEKGVPIPKFKEANSYEDAVAACCDIGFPVVIKPIDNSGARGISLVENESALSQAFNWAKKNCFQKETLLVEEYLTGPQISTESLVYDGKIYTTGFADRNYELNHLFAPFFIEDGHTIPSELRAEDQAEIIKVVEKALPALGIDFGVGKGDLVLTPQGPKVLEFAARLSGGRFSTDTVPLATGVHLVKAMIKLSIGETIDPADLEPKYNRGAAQRYFFPKPGRVTSVDGINKANRPEWVNRVEIYVKPEDDIKQVTNHVERAGYVITSGETRAEAVERAEWARSQIDIQTSSV